VDGAQSLHVSFISREDKMYKKVCVVCEKKFNTNHPNYLCCSKKCTNINKVNRRYERENGNWEYYFKHLLSKKENCKLTIAQLMSILEKQNYKCALSGAPLTCERTRGEISNTNASIDRIIAGGEYNKDNVQLVCRAINSFRGPTDLEDFINWCKRVTNHAIQKQKETLQKRVRSTKEKG